MYNKKGLQNKLTEAQLEKYMTGIERYDSGCGSAGIPGSPTMTGANLLDKALVVAQAGVLTNDAQKLAHVRDAQKSVYTYVTKDDGFYRDGSFIQHHTLSYTAGYGATLYGGIGVFFYMLDGTPWAIQYADGSEQMVYDTIFNSIEPLIDVYKRQHQSHSQDHTDYRIYDIHGGQSIFPHAVSDKNCIHHLID